MFKIFAKPWEFLKSLFALAFPMFTGGRSASAEAADAIGRWAARTVLVAVVLLLLWLINQFSGLKHWIPYGRIGEIWLPLLALCLYAIIWLGWWLYRVLSLEIEPATSEFPDIDRAWSLALEALNRADIHLDNTPLFLVLGWTSGSEGALFQAAGVRAQVKQVPQDPTEPIHVTANRDGIWVTCPGVSLLGQHNPAALGETPDEKLSSLVEDSIDQVLMSGESGDATIGVGDLAGQLQKVRERSIIPKRLIDPEPYKARLRHLCRLITRDRQGFCPVNGVLVLLPITAADPKAELEEIANSCRTDLTVALEAFRIRCPVLVMVCNLEKLHGFGDLVERLPAGQTGRRIGQRFPLVPDLEPGEVPAKVQSLLEWIGDTLFPSMVYSLFEVESPGGEEISDVVQANSRLFRFMIEMRERHERLAHLVKGCIPSLPGELVMFGGCYFAGTGDPATEQAFASGVLMRMIQDQDHVTWTADYLSEDASLLRLAHLFRVSLLVFIALGSLLALSLILWMVFFRGASPNPS